MFVAIEYLSWNNSSEVEQFNLSPARENCFIN